MRTMTRRLPLLRLGLGAALMATPVTAVALAAGQAEAQSAMQVHVGSSHLSPGRRLVVTGTTSSTDAGQTVVLEYAAGRGQSWQTLTSSRISPTGSFRLAAPLWRTGRVRVSGGGSGSGAQAAATDVAPSEAHQVTVGSVLSMRTVHLAVLAGQRVSVLGRLLPAAAGRRVRLLVGTGHGWRPVASARTGPRGGFTLRTTMRSTGIEALRVTFSGDSLNSASSRRAGDVTGYREAVASWYQDGGQTACGFHAGYGVANRYLPCGTRVTFNYGGNTVTAVVDDRGPYVGGRDYDLNQNTAAALGFGGVATVWASR